MLPRRACSLLCKKVKLQRLDDHGLRRSSSSSIIHSRQCVSAGDGRSVFASTTIKLCSSEAPSQSVLESVVKEALASVRQALGSECHALLLTTSLPRSLAATTLSHLVQYAEGLPVAGCSSLQWQPLPEPPSVPAKQPSVDVPAPPEESPATAGEGARGKAAAEQQLPYHITLGGLHVPDADMHAIQTPTSSLPFIPELASALSSRPPQFILFSTQEGTLDILCDRLENLFSGSVICAATGTLQLSGRPVGGLAVQSGIRGMELWSIKASSPAVSATPSNSLRDIGPMAFVGNQVLSVGCSGLMLLPRPLPTTHNTSASTRAGSAGASSSNRGNSGGTSKSSACLPSPSSALLCQALLGNDRFFSLMIAEHTMRHLQPPHTPMRSWQHLRQPNTPSTAAAREPLQQSQPQRGSQTAHHAAGRAGGEEAMPCPPVTALPATIRVCRQAGEEDGNVSGVASRERNKSGSSSGGNSSAQSNARGSTSVVFEPSKASKPPSRRLPASSTTWSLSSQVQACGGSGLPHVVARLQHSLPIVSLGQHFSIFPGEEVQLRIFEKRYQWLIRQAVEQQGCFAIASARGFCTAVVVNRYILNNSDFYIVVEGKGRLLFNPASTTAVPACFGLDAVEDALVVEDQTQITASEASAIMRSAGQILSLIAAGAQAHAAASNEALSSSGLSFMGGLMHQQHELQGDLDGSSDSETDSDYDDNSDEELSRDWQEKKRDNCMLAQAYAQQLEKCTLDTYAASQFSLMISALMPIEVEKRRRFMLSFNSKGRLQEQKKHLASFPNVAASTAGSLMACSPTHPLRQLLGLHLPPITD